MVPEREEVITIKAQQQPAASTNAGAGKRAHILNNMHNEERKIGVRQGLKLPSPSHSEILPPSKQSGTF